MKDPVTRHLDTRFDSPLERKLYREFRDMGFVPEENYEVGPFRIDLAFPEIKLAIEIDGAAYHTSPKQRSYDLFRQNLIEEEGWTFKRYEGWFVHRHPGVAVAQILLKYFPDKITKSQTRSMTMRIAIYMRNIDPDLSKRLMDRALA